MNQKGLRRLFFDWHIKLLEYFWETQEPMGSRAVWEHLKEAGVKASQKAHGTVSRASVILFLNELVDEGIMDYYSETGKGGYHRIYRPNFTLRQKKGFKEYVSERVLKAAKLFMTEE